jgi:hypothetical protein
MLVIPNENKNVGIRNKRIKRVIIIIMKKDFNENIYKK